MKRIASLCLAGTSVVAASYGCSQGNLAPPPPVSASGAGGTTAMMTGGTGGTTGGSSATGGSGGSTGGSSATGGTGGSTGGTGGSTGGTGGSTGGSTSGSSGMTATGGTGGSTAGTGSGATGGTGAGGMGTGGGMMMGGGGMTSAGGSAGMGMAGTGTSMAGMGAGGMGDLTSVAKVLDGYMWIGTCTDGAASGLDCPLNDPSSNMCPNPNATDYATRGEVRNTMLTLGGDSATTYTITLEFRGILGTRCYTGGTPAAAQLASNPEMQNNGWYVGGTPTDSKWNTYEIHVSPPVSGEANVYYLNAFPQNPSGWCEKHETFPMKYTASFKAMGGSTLTLVLHDSNCLGQQNCGGPDNQSSCANPRTIDLSGMPPQPAGFTQPYKQSNGFYPQFVEFAVRSVTAG